MRTSCYILACWLLTASSLAEVIFKACKDGAGHSYSAGESWTDQKTCQHFQCGQDPSGQDYVEITGCPKQEVAAPCYLKVYPYMTYPDCCPQLACPPQASSSNTSGNKSGNETTDSGGLTGNEGYFWNMMGHGRRQTA